MVWQKVLFVASAACIACGSSSPPTTPDGGVNPLDAGAAGDVGVAPVDASNPADVHADVLDASDGGTHTGMIIPLYSDPSDGTWTTVITAKQSNPSVDIVAIVNPDSGPGNAKDNSYVTGIASFETAGIQVVGYVATGYGTSSYSAVSDVEAEVDDWVKWYPNIQGIFFDEMSNSATEQTYYQTLATYVAKAGLTLTIGNPGTSVPDALVGIFTNLVIYESQGLPATSNIDGYRSTYGTQGFSYIAYGVSSLPAASAMSTLDAYVHYMFITDLNGSNPYGALPSYFSAEIAALASL